MGGAVQLSSGALANVSGVWTLGMAKAFASLGLDLDLLCVDAGLDAKALTDPRGLLPRDWAGRLWRAALARSKDPFLGLKAASAWEPRANHLVWLLFLSADDFGSGFEAAIRVQSLLARGQVVSHGREAALHLVQVHRVADSLPITDNQIEYLAGILTKLFRFATDGDFRLREVRFDHPFRGETACYEAFFGCPVRFDSERTELVLDEEVWQMPLMHGNSTLHRQLTEMAQAEHAGLATQRLADTARDCLRTLLASGQHSIDDVADVLHMTPRTLQRRLQEEGTSFRAVLEEARRAAVEEGMAHNLPPEDLGRAAGFTNARSLKRAMKRWGVGSSGDDV